MNGCARVLDKADNQPGTGASAWPCGVSPRGDAPNAPSRAATAERKYYGSKRWLGVPGFSWFSIRGERRFCRSGEGDCRCVTLGNPGSAGGHHRRVFRRLPQSARVHRSDTDSLPAQPALHQGADLVPPLGGPRLETAHQHGLGVGGPDQPPSISEQHPRAVHVDHARPLASVLLGAPDDPARARRLRTSRRGGRRNGGGRERRRPNPRRLLREARKVAASLERFSSSSWPSLFPTLRLAPQRARLAACWERVPRQRRLRRQPARSSELR